MTTNSRYPLARPERGFTYTPASLGTSFLGIYSTQAWSDFLLWERCFNEHPALRMAYELGTGTGGFSLFLALQCWQRGMRFWTMDWQNWVPPSPVHDLLGLSRARMRGDLWQGGDLHLREQLADGAQRPCVLFCDDGDKPREVRTFAPLLRAGDVLAVHDWPYECGPSAIAGLPLRPWGAELAETFQSPTRWFEVLGGTA